MGGVDYQINFNEDNSSFIAYVAGQNTDRKHYTGLYPIRTDYASDLEFSEAESAHLKNPPYGNTDNLTLQGGTQINHRIHNFLNGSNTITAGLEYIVDDIVDSIPQYGYGTNQKTENIGAFFQSDWKISSSFTFLAGLRADKHNLLNHPIVSPRLSLLYKLQDYTQFRFTWGNRIQSSTSL